MGSVKKMFLEISRSVKKLFLEISQNSLETTGARDSFFIKLQACSFIKK